jgi:hypothetical protein
MSFARDPERGEYRDRQGYLRARWVREALRDLERELDLEERRIDA